MSQKVFFTDSNNINLCGILSDPTSNISQKPPIVICCHGDLSSKESKTFVTLEPLLNSKDIASFRFDFFGHGESGGKFEDLTITEASNNILAAIEFLKSKGYTKIGLLGSSFGGLCSITAASKSQDLTCLALKAPVSNWMEMIWDTRDPEYVDRWREDDYIMLKDSSGMEHPLRYNFWRDAKENDGYLIGQNIQISTIIIHGDKDLDVPVEQSRHLYGAIDNSELRIIEGADHRFTNPILFKKMVGIVVEFFVEKLTSK